MKCILCLTAVLLVATTATAQATAGGSGCASAAAAFATAASLAVARTSALVEVAATAKAQAQSAAEAAASASTKAKALTSVQITADRCVSADATSYSRAAASAAATATSAALAVATAYGSAYSAAVAAGVAQGTAKAAACNCTAQQSSIEKSSLSVADSFTKLSAGVQAWASCESARAQAISYAESCTTASSASMLKFCQACGKGYRKIELSVAQNTQSSQNSGSASCTAELRKLFGDTGPCAP